ncbi:Pre-mRNA-splicing factor Cwf15/Cwc15 [Lobosporangium transversale]|uniref:Pre-mRNA-splicing factor Cwf15/Cwc15 n=1 Tax=Lobosporangium transversale TaxID=64571 RepID=A0A1Y2H323_9FUNG|nr:Pre-mRNA-splicing factor Cwf15/Cwc15 [Lobosporangium transversale]ORZ27472.1 Pre-mRNA-splicing factor Cwf15/Cwc15 [Lobosporangium transversale]|eukprot:XP_021885199.1 Pre-mRNA-splicing factor Cwf15/Cwc15 [Lobosporangium transversale]
MTTAARPTFDPARGKGSQAPTRIYSSRDLASHTKLKYRKSGQTAQDELNRLDLKAQLLKAEQNHFEKVKRTTKLAEGLSNSFKDDDDDDVDDNKDTTKKIGSSATRSSEEPAETPLERKRRLLKEAERLDKDDSDSDDSDKGSDESDSDESDSDDDEDDTAELLRELEKIKRERAEEKERQERLQREEEEKERQAQAAAGNPLLNMNNNTAVKDFSVKRRWDDDVIFKNQARGIDDKPKKRFINDTLRSDFHRKFMNKYVQ